MLKEICFGSAMAMPSSDWLRTGVVFHEAEALHAFGLKAQKGPTKAFQMVLQAYILKYLMFHKFSKKVSRFEGNKIICDLPNIYLDYIFSNPSENKGFNKYKLDNGDSMRNVKEPGWE